MRIWLTQRLSVASVKQFTVLSFSDKAGTNSPTLDAWNV